MNQIHWTTQQILDHGKILLHEEGIDWTVDSEIVFFLNIIFKVQITMPSNYLWLFVVLVANGVEIGKTVRLPIDAPIDVLIREISRLNESALSSSLS